MTFRDWLISESSGNGHKGVGGGNKHHTNATGGTFGGPFWDLLYPSSPADYQWASTIPVEHFWLQWRLQRGLELGRTLHNVDNAEFQKRRYTSIESLSAPDGGDGFWTHRDDGDKPNTKVVNNLDLVWIGDGKNSKDTKSIEGYHYRTNNTFGKTEIWPFYSDTEKILRDRFKDEASGKWPTVPDNFDEPWTKKYESYMIEYGGGGGAATTAMHGGIQEVPGININNMPGIKSRISANDNIKEKRKGDGDNEETPEEMYGFKSWLDKKRAKESGAKDIHKKRMGAPMRVPAVYT